MVGLGVDVYIVYIYIYIYTDLSLGHLGCSTMFTTPAAASPGSIGGIAEQHRGQQRGLAQARLHGPRDRCAFDVVWLVFYVVHVL